MQRARRVALVAALAVLGAAVLAGCRSQPNVAAYVGDMKITEDRVNRIVDEDKAGVNKGSLGTGRQEVVRWLVVGEVARRLAGERGIAIEAPDYTAMAQEAQIPPDAQVARVYGDWLVAIRALYGKAEPVQPSEQDLREIYGQLVADGSVEPGTPFEQVVGRIDPARLAPVLGLRNMLRDAAKRYHVVINPKYRPLVLPLNGVPLPLSSENDAL